MHLLVILVGVVGVFGDKFLPVYGQEEEPLKLAEAQKGGEIDTLSGLLVADELPRPNKTLTLKLAAAQTQNISCTSSDLDFLGDLIISSDQSTGSGRIGDSLYCLPNDRCNSSTTDVYLQIVKTGEVFRPGIEFTKAGTGSLQCVAVINGNKVTKSISVTIGGDPSVSCTSSDLNFSGSLSISPLQLTGSGSVGDTLACMPNDRCYPSTTSLYLQMVETSEVFNSASIRFTRAGRGTYKCVAVINGRTITKNIAVTISGVFLNLANTLTVLVLAGAAILLQKP